MDEQLSFLDKPTVKVKDGWSHSDMVFYCEGQGFGVTNDGRTICLGDAKTIEAYLNQGKTEGLNQIQIEVLEKVKEIENNERKSTDNFRAIKPGSKRDNASKVVKSKQVNFRQPAPRKTISLHKTKLQG